jgi:hypothetical protein
MSGTVTATDLGGAGGGSSDAALAPLIAALTDNSTQLIASTAKLGLLETVQQQLQTAVAALSSSIDKLISKIGSGKVSGGGGSKGSAIDRELDYDIRQSTKKAIQEGIDAGMAYGPSRIDFKLGSESQKAFDKEFAQLLKESDLAGLAAGMAFGPSRVDYLVGKEKEKQRSQQTQYQPTQEAHVEAFKAAELSKEAAQEELVIAAQEKSAAALWRRGLDKIQKMREDAAANELAWSYGPSRVDYLAGKDAVKEKENAAKEEAEAAALWRKGLNALAKKKSREQDELNALEQKYLRSDYEQRRKYQKDQAKLELAMEALANQTVRGDASSETGESKDGKKKGFSWSKAAIVGAISKMLTKAFGPAGAVVFTIGAGLVALNAAIQASVAIFEKWVSGLIKSAAAYAPGVASAASLVLRDLEAVVGVYSTLTLQAVIPLTRVIADRLYPVMVSLGESMASFISAITPMVDYVLGIFGPAMQLLGKLIQSVITLAQPLISILSFITNVLSVVLGTLFGAIEGTIDLIMALLNPLFKGFASMIDYINGFVWALREAIIQLSSYIPFLGEAIKKALTQKSTIGLAAATSTKLTGFADIGNTAVQNAYLATSGFNDPQRAVAEQILKNDLPNKWAKEFEQNKNNPNLGLAKEDGNVNKKMAAPEEFFGMFKFNFAG